MDLVVRGRMNGVDYEHFDRSTRRLKLNAERFA
jgi:hypothetical protein